MINVVNNNKQNNKVGRFSTHRLECNDDGTEDERAYFVLPPNRNPPGVRSPSRSSALCQAGPDAAWMEMMEKLVVNLQPRNESGWYRKLRVFSGRLPVPVNEDDYESWADKAEQMITEWKVSDAEKKKRIAESLTGPAMSVIRSLTPTPSLTVRDYLDALEKSYGTLITPAESLRAFQSCYQKSEWSHSQYLQELQTLLRRAIRQGSVKEYEADYLRLQQFIDGVLYNESYLSSLQLDTRLNNPPSYIELLQMVRKQEARQEEKAKKRAHEIARANCTTSCDSFEATATSAPVVQQVLDKSTVQQVVQQVMEQMMKGNANQLPTPPALNNTWSVPSSQSRPHQQHRRKRDQNQSQVQRNTTYNSNITDINMGSRIMEF
ncbi:paraneoplastic antigen Ma1 homolog [Ptychodera flava]|uniref:paraneoplastic antigen Ma1 homolog n=1 Tax=Ptychodera flava TaxID=63121 RepID=UPI00396A4D64